LLGQFLDEAELAVAGIVDDDVEAAEVVVGLFDRGEIGGAIVDVEGERQQCVAVFGGEVVEGGHVTGGGGHLVAAFERSDRPFAAEPARGTGDEPDFFTHARVNARHSAKHSLRPQRTGNSQAAP
jgi:hypothetical protein